MRERFAESHSADTPEALSARDALLRTKISELGLTIAGSRLEPLIERLYAELAAAGITLRPRVYLSDEWGCPDGIPIIGVPFYLVDERLTALQRERLDYVEAESDDEILAYLRHETGHAFNYAYRLHARADWDALFGPFSRPYRDDYVPAPFSHEFVQHIAGWYAQKHPDEDFAETFAVWLTPHHDWRAEYAGWPCLAKLEYVDAVVAELGRAPPLVGDLNYDASSELSHPLSDYFERNAYVAEQVGAHFDGDLRRMFSGGHEGVPAGVFIRARRRALVQRVSFWTGLGEHTLRSLVEHLAQRADELALRTGSDGERHAEELAVYVTALAMNRIYHGDYVAK